MGGGGGPRVRGGAWWPPTPFSCEFFFLYLRTPPLRPAPRPPGPLGMAYGTRFVAKSIAPS